MIFKGSDAAMALFLLLLDMFETASQYNWK